ncbi:acyl-CoA N-acyltransferase [Aspergillus karnatakaensis]|uniref:GNAT family N-acetyltransferase n=1 Tax=Aspergillus karnatakaensis TaxID=1810916 RepID=UPI003CCD0F9C
MPSTSTPTFTITPLPPTDAPEAFAVSDMAFASFNAMLHTTYPLPPSSLAHLTTTRLHLIKTYPKATMLKAVDNASGKIIGAARWLVVTEDEIVTESLEDVITGYLAFRVPETNVPASRGFYAMATRGKRAVLSVKNGQGQGTGDVEVGEDADREGSVVLRKRVELETLFVHPEHQGKGVGSALLDWGVCEAERLGLVVYLEATEAGRPLYERAGFEAVETVVFDAAEFGGFGRQTYTFMLREPRGVLGE